MSKLGIFLTVVAALMTTAANLCLRKALAHVAEGTMGLHRLTSLFGDITFLSGTLLYGLAMLPWLKVVSMEPVGSAYPILVGLTFVLLLIGATLIVNEPLSVKKIGGVLLILVGIAIVAKS